jgi:curved DNA-binding protein CbpA
MNDQCNYYEVMSLDRSATQREIKLRYRELARIYHPDLAGNQTAGVRTFMQINKAYRALGDEERRKLYDTALDEEARADAEKRRSVQYAVQITSNLRDATDAIMRGDQKTARVACEAVLKIVPNNPEALHIMGDVLTQMGETDAAIAAYRKSCESKPSYIVESKITRLETRTVKKDAVKKDAVSKKGEAPRAKPVGGMRGWFAKR